MAKVPKLSISLQMQHGPASDLHDNHTQEKDHSQQNCSGTEETQEKRK